MRSRRCLPRACEWSRTCGANDGWTWKAAAWKPPGASSARRPSAATARDSIVVLVVPESLSDLARMYCTVLYTYTLQNSCCKNLVYGLTTLNLSQGRVLAPLHLPIFCPDKPSGIDNTEIHISFLGKECVFRGSFLRHAARRTPPLVVRRGAMASATRVHAPCLPCSTPQRAVSARSSRAISQRAVSARREPSAREATEAQPNVQRVTRETPRTGRPSCAK